VLPPEPGDLTTDSPVLEYVLCGDEGFVLVIDKVEKLSYHSMVKASGFSRDRLVEEGRGGARIEWSKLLARVDFNKGFRRHRERDLLQWDFGAPATSIYRP
jgi:hypothetical protein